MEINSLIDVLALAKPSESFGSPRSLRSALASFIPASWALTLSPPRSGFLTLKLLPRPFRNSSGFFPKSKPFMFDLKSLKKSRSLSRDSNFIPEKKLLSGDNALPSVSPRELACEMRFLIHFISLEMGTLTPSIPILRSLKLPTRIVPTILATVDRTVCNTLNGSNRALVALYTAFWAPSLFLSLADQSEIATRPFLKAQ